LAIRGGSARRGDTVIDDAARQFQREVATVSAENDALISGFHGIPSPEKLRQMSFVELAELLSSCEKGSPKFLVVAHERARRSKAGGCER